MFIISAFSCTCDVQNYIINIIILYQFYFVYHLIHFYKNNSFELIVSYIRIHYTLYYNKNTMSWFIHRKTNLY